MRNRGPRNLNILGACVALVAAQGTALGAGFEPYSGTMEGWKWQYGDLLAGAEVAGSDFSYGADAPLGWMAARGRVGLLVAPDLMMFGAVGYGRPAIDLPASDLYGGLGSDAFGGWQFGSGAEYQFTGMWSARVNYLYTDFDAETLSYTVTSVPRDRDIQTVRAGLAFKF